MENEIPDDTDDVDEASEARALEAWKVREFQRIHVAEMATDVVSSARRNMTDAQVKIENAAMGKNVEEEVRRERQQIKARKEKQKNQHKSIKSSDHSHKSNVSGVHRGAFA